MKSIFFKCSLIALLLGGLQFNTLMAQTASNINQEQRLEKQVAKKTQQYNLSTMQQAQLRQIQTQFLEKTKTLNRSNPAFRAAAKERQQAFVALLTPTQKVKMEALQQERKAKRQERELKRENRRKRANANSKN